MAPSVPISILVVALVLCIFMHVTTMVIAAGSVAASTSPAVDLEAKALMETRWWSGTSNGTCSEGGSITEINMAGAYLHDEIRKLNFSSFLNLVHLNLSDMGFLGSIPHGSGSSPFPFEMERVQFTVEILFKMIYAQKCATS